MKVRGKLGGSESVVDVLIADGIIQAIAPADWSQPLAPEDLGDQTLHLAPGFVDLQINGYGGVDFNDPATTTEQIAATVRALWRTGMTAMCPTVITGSPAHIKQCFANLLRAAEEFPEVNHALAGLHLEGPFISPEDGPRGAHPKQHVQAPNWDQFQHWQDAARGQIRIVTLSPEWPEANRFIERAAAAGVIVAIGHTAATPGQIADAVSAGARMSTHLGNGSHAKIDRHPNYIWEQLANDGLWASFIVDGHHLPPSVVKCFLRSKGIARSVLVTDAIAAAGCPPGQYKLGDVAVEVLPSGRVNLPGTPYLAGSALEMHDAIGKTVAYSDATLAEALQMASENPATLLGVTEQHGTLTVGRPANLTLFRWEQPTLSIVATISGGKLVYRHTAY